jgi:hypothetical protein
LVYLPTKPGSCPIRDYSPGVERMEDRRLLALLTVTTTAESGPGSLRDAFAQANLDPAQDTIQFAPAVTGTITLQSALPDLATAIVLEGPGASVLTVARSADPGTPAFRIFTVTTGAEVTISGLTLTGGRALEGGGILNVGTLTITASPQRQPGRRQRRRKRFRWRSIQQRDADSHRLHPQQQLGRRWRTKYLHAY